MYANYYCFAGYEFIEESLSDGTNININSFLQKNKNKYYIMQSFKTINASETKPPKYEPQIKM